MAEDVVGRGAEKMDAAERARLATADQLALDRLGRRAMFRPQCQALPYKLPKPSKKKGEA